MDITQASFKLKVALSGFANGVTVTEEKDVEVKAKSMSIFVQTDKAMYKPGETGMLTSRQIIITSLKYFKLLIFQSNSVPLQLAQCSNLTMAPSLLLFQ